MSDHVYQSKIQTLIWENAKLKNLLNDSEVRFRAIKNNLECIGPEKLHADFNCMHCLAVYGAKKIIESGFQPVTKGEK